jgi:hypothetical protein
VTETVDEKIFLAAEFRIESGLVYACGSFQVLDGGVGKPSFPEHRDSLLQQFLSAKVLWTPHVSIIR